MKDDEMLDRNVAEQVVGRIQHKPQLCWQCANAVPNPNTGRGCAWSRDKRPVEGWVARPTVLKEIDKPESERGKSYHIITCPEFVQG